MAKRIVGIKKSSPIQNNLFRYDEDARTLEFLAGPNADDWTPLAYLVNSDLPESQVLGIKVNGGASQSGVVELTIPTKTSDLTNDGDSATDSSKYMLTLPASAAGHIPTLTADGVADSGKSFGGVSFASSPNENSVPSEKSVQSFVEGKGYQTADQVAAAINAKVASVLTWQGTKDNLAQIQALTAHNVGDVWSTTDDGSEYVWTGTKWEFLGREYNLANCLTKVDPVAAGDLVKLNADGSLKDANVSLGGADFSADPSETVIPNEKSVKNYIESKNYVSQSGDFNQPGQLVKLDQNGKVPVSSWGGVFTFTSSDLTSGVLTKTFASLGFTDDIQHTVQVVNPSGVVVNADSRIVMIFDATANPKAFKLDLSLLDATELTGTWKLIV